MRFAFLILFFISFSEFFAQDFIFKKDNSKIAAKIIEINPKEIKYISLPDSIQKSISKKEVAIIIYKDGSSEVIISEPEPEPLIYNIRDLEKQAHYEKRRMLDSVKRAKKLSDKEISLKRKNYICINFFEFIDESIGVTYSRNILKNYAFIHLPISIGYGTPYFSNGMLSETKREYMMNSKLLDAALGLNFYLYHSYYNSPYVGIMFRYTRYEGEFNWYAKNNNFTLEKYNYLLTLGIRLRSPSGVTFSPSLNYGLYRNNYLNPEKVVHYDILSKYNNGLTFNLSILLGYSF